MTGRGTFALLLIAAAILLRPWDAARHLLPWGGQASGVGASQQLRGRAVRAVDGDTLEVRLDGGGGTETVRVIGVDTPETVKPDTPVQCFGPRASRFAHRTVEGRRVRLLTGVEPRDFYGRLLAYVWVEGDAPGRPRAAAMPPRRRPRERFLEVELLRRGLARTLTFRPNDRFASRFERLEQNAARAGKGLWNAC
jgi:micrococcal nuclease